MITNNKKCIDCSYYEYDGDENEGGCEIGICHRFPPAFSTKKACFDGNAEGRLYVNPAIDWCGEFKNDK